MHLEFLPCVQSFSPRFENNNNHHKNLHASGTCLKLGSFSAFKTDRGVRRQGHQGGIGQVLRQFAALGLLLATGVRLFVGHTAEVPGRSELRCQPLQRLHADFLWQKRTARVRIQEELRWQRGGDDVQN